ncbi:MAG: ATP synthase F1 subunit epsilon [Planctomycetota bacterium]|nr:ATP synthase F1 subunit epsilon [Planctomycetota bacterium]
MAEHTSLNVSVVTPEGSAYEGEAHHVVAPAFDGEMAVYPLHAPMVAVLGRGELRVTRTDGAQQNFYLSGGVLQVSRDEVSILAEAVTPSREVDVAAAEAELAEAMATPAVGEVEIEARMTRIDEARSRIRVAGRSADRNVPTADQILEKPVE